MTRQENGKTKSTAKTPKISSKSGGSATATANNNNKLRIIIAGAVGFVLILALILGLVFGIKGCSDKSKLINQSARAINI